MMARAPGKVVLSGAYAVLEGAPALVAAVDRYVLADAEREAALVVPEVAEALRERDTGRASALRETAPWFDARELRDERGDRKLGLGSSAAILVASLAALELAAHPSLDDAALADRTWRPALRAHRAAQGGGSGIDVAASAFGGILRFQRDAQRAAHPPTVTPFALPASLFLEVWSADHAAPTAAMLAKVADLAAARPATHRAIIQRLSNAADAAVQAADGSRFIQACRAQVEALDELGQASGAPIVTREMRALDDALRGEGAVAMPSGAGGGDVVLLVSTTPVDARARRRAQELGFSFLALSLGARGVHQVRAPAQAISDPWKSPTGDEAIS